MAAALLPHLRAACQFPGHCFRFPDHRDRAAGREGYQSNVFAVEITCHGRDLLGTDELWFLVGALKFEQIHSHVSSSEMKIRFDFTQEYDREYSSRRSLGS
jgi:hypothetical protein